MADCIDTKGCKFKDGPLGGCFKGCARAPGFDTGEQRWREACEAMAKSLEARAGVHVGDWETVLLEAAAHCRSMAEEYQK